jgi:hypothetical protein
VRHHPASYAHGFNAAVVDDHFVEPTTVVRRSLLGASQDTPTGERRNRTCGDERHVVLAGLDARAAVLITLARSSSSQYRRIEKSRGPRSQITLTSDWCNLGIDSGHGDEVDLPEVPATD